MKSIEHKPIVLILLIGLLVTTRMKAQEKTNVDNHLNTKEQSIISIASLTALGDVDHLKTALTTGLEAGLTVNEIKEVLIHTYAYCGFPRSIMGLQTFMAVLDDRKASGIADTNGKEATPLPENETKYQRGKTNLEQLLQVKQEDTLKGYSAFAPTIDRFLKEHLFADLFERDVLTFYQRELVTISVISALGNAEPMLISHVKIGMNLGFSPQQLSDFIQIIKPHIGRKKTKAAKKTIQQLLKNQ